MMRSTVTLFLCWCLLIAPLASNQAMAQTDGLQCAQGQNSAACNQLHEDIGRAGSGLNGSGSGVQMTPEEAQAYADRMRADAERGVIVDRSSEVDTGVTGAYKTGSFATLVLAISAAIVGSYFAFSCVTQPSVWVFFAVSIAYMIAEIVMIAQIKEASTRRLSVLTNTSVETKTVQEDALNAAIEQTQGAIDHANTRYIVTSVMAAFYVIAVVVSIIEGIIAIYPGTKQDSCKIPSSQNYIANIDWQAKAKKILAQFLGIETVHAQSEGSGSGSGSGAGAENTDYDALGIVGALAVVFLVVVPITSGVFMAAGRSNGFARAAVMAVYAAFVIAAAVLIKEKKDQLEKRKTIYQELLAQLSIRTTTTTNIAGPTTTTDLGGGGTVVSGNSLGLGEGDPLKGNCASGDQEKVNSIKADLGCKKTPMTITGNPVIEGNTIIDLPSSITDGLKNSKTFAQDLASGKGVNGGIRNSTLGNLASLNKMKKELGGKYQDFLKKYKNEESDSIDKLEADIRKDLLDKVNKELSGYSKDQIASMTEQLLGFGAPVSKEIVELAKKHEIINDFKSINKPGASNIKNLVPKLKFGEEPGISAAQETEIDGASSMQGLDIKENDIATDSGASLFLIITNRYRKTAYPIIFDKKGPATRK